MQEQTTPFKKLLAIIRHPANNKNHTAIIINCCRNFADNPNNKDRTERLFINHVLNAPHTLEVIQLYCKIYFPAA